MSYTFYGSDRQDPFKVLEGLYTHGRPNSRTLRFWSELCQKLVAQKHKDAMQQLAQERCE